MALLFPINPSVGDTWTDPSNGMTYRWDGKSWDATPFPISSLPPLDGSPLSSDLIWERGGTNISPVNDGDSVLIGGNILSAKINLSWDGTITGPTHHNSIPSYRFYLDGSSIIDASSTSVGLRVTQRGTGNPFEVWNGTVPVVVVSGGTTPSVIISTNTTSPSFRVNQANNTGNLLELWSPVSTTRAAFTVYNDGSIDLENANVRGDLSVDGSINLNGPILQDGRTVASISESLTLNISPLGTLYPVNPIGGDPFNSIWQLMEWVKNNVVTSHLIINISNATYNWTFPTTLRFPEFDRITVNGNASILNLITTDSNTALVLNGTTSLVNCTIRNGNTGLATTFIVGSSTRTILDTVRIFADLKDAIITGTECEIRGNCYAEGSVVVDKLLHISGVIDIKNDQAPPRYPVVIFAGEIRYNNGGSLTFSGTNTTILAYNPSKVPPVLHNNTIWNNSHTNYNSYVLPIASSTVLGGIRIGEGLSISPTTGVLDVTGGAGATNLRVDNRTGETLTVVSDTGTDAIIPKADENFAGLITALNQQKLNTVSPYANPNVNSDWNAVAGDALILNKPFIPLNLDGLTDVVISFPDVGQVLRYNGTSWINDTISGAGSIGLDDLIDVTISSKEKYKVIQSNGLTWIDSDPAVAGGGTGSITVRVNGLTGVPRPVDPLAANNFFDSIDNALLWLRSSIVLKSDVVIELTAGQAHGVNAPITNSNTATILTINGNGSTISRVNQSVIDVSNGRVIVNNAFINGSVTCQLNTTLELNGCTLEYTPTASFTSVTGFGNLVFAGATPTVVNGNVLVNNRAVISGALTINTATTGIGINALTIGGNGIIEYSATGRITLQNVANRNVFIRHPAVVDTREIRWVNTPTFIWDNAIQTTLDLNALRDVVVTLPQTNNSLRFNGTNWVNVVAPSVFAGSVGVTLNVNSTTGSATPVNPLGDGLGSGDPFLLPSQALEWARNNVLNVSILVIRLALGTYNEPARVQVGGFGTSVIQIESVGGASSIIDMSGNVNPNIAFILNNGCILAFVNLNITTAGIGLQSNRNGRYSLTSCIITTTTVGARSVFIQGQDLRIAGGSTVTLNGLLNLEGKLSFAGNSNLLVNSTALNAIEFTSTSNIMWGAGSRITIGVSAKNVWVADAAGIDTNPSNWFGSPIFVFAVPQIASATALGRVRIGSGITVGPDGTISAEAQEGTGTDLDWKPAASQGVITSSTGADAIIPRFSTNAGLVPGVVSSTTHFLRADGTWAVAGGGGGGGIGSQSINNLTDVTITNVDDGQALVYDLGTAQWRNLPHARYFNTNTASIVLRVAPTGVVAPLNPTSPTGGTFRLPSQAVEWAKANISSSSGVNIQISPGTYTENEQIVCTYQTLTGMGAAPGDVTILDGTGATTSTPFINILGSSAISNLTVTSNRWSVNINNSGRLTVLNCVINGGQNAVHAALRTSGSLPLRLGGGSVVVNGRVSTFSTIDFAQNTTLTVNSTGTSAIDFFSSVDIGFSFNSRILLPGPSKIVNIHSANRINTAPIYWGTTAAGNAPIFQYQVPRIHYDNLTLNVDAATGVPNPSYPVGPTETDTSVNTTGQAFDNPWSAASWARQNVTVGRFFRIFIRNGTYTWTNNTQMRYPQYLRTTIEGESRAGVILRPTTTDGTSPFLFPVSTTIVRNLTIENTNTALAQPVIYRSSVGAFVVLDGVTIRANTGALINAIAWEIDGGGQVQGPGALLIGRLIIGTGSRLSVLGPLEINGNGTNEAIMALASSAIDAAGSGVINLSGGNNRIRIWPYASINRVSTMWTIPPTFIYDDTGAAFASHTNAGLVRVGNGIRVDSIGTLTTYRFGSLTLNVAPTGVASPVNPIGNTLGSGDPFNTVSSLITWCIDNVTVQNLTVNVITGTYVETQNWGFPRAYTTVIIQANNSTFHMSWNQAPAIASITINAGIFDVRNATFNMQLSGGNTVFSRGNGASIFRVNNIIFNGNPLGDQAFFTGRGRVETAGSLPVIINNAFISVGERFTVGTALTLNYNIASTTRPAISVSTILHYFSTLDITTAGTINLSGTNKTVQNNGAAFSVVRDPSRWPGTVTFAELHNLGVVTRTLDVHGNLLRNGYIVPAMHGLTGTVDIDVNNVTGTANPFDPTGVNNGGVRHPFDTLDSVMIWLNTHSMVSRNLRINLEETQIHLFRTNFRPPGYLRNIIFNGDTVSNSGARATLMCNHVPGISPFTNGPFSFQSLVINKNPANDAVMISEPASDRRYKQTFIGVDVFWGGDLIFNTTDNVAISGNANFPNVNFTGRIGLIDSMLQVNAPFSIDFPTTAPITLTGLASVIVGSGTITFRNNTEIFANGAGFITWDSTRYLPSVNFRGSFFGSNAVGNWDLDQSSHILKNRGRATLPAGGPWHIVHFPRAYRAGVIPTVILGPEAPGMFVSNITNTQFTLNGAANNVSSWEATGSGFG